MGGRQKSKQVAAVVNEQTQSASQAENMPSHQSLSDGELRELRLLSEVHVDDPRTQKVASSDQRIVVDKFNIRKRMDDYELDNLRQSLISDGQQKPVIVTPRDDELWVVSGNTRVKAARSTLTKKEKSKRVEEISILPVEMDDRKARLFALIGNTDNSLPMARMTDDELGAAIEKLVEVDGWTQDQVAQAIHRDQSFVSRHLRVHKVDPNVEKMLKNKAIMESHAEVIMMLPKFLQSGVADHVGENKLTVQDTQKLVSKFKTIVKAGEGIPEDILDENIITPFLDEECKDDTGAIASARSVAAGLSALSSEIERDTYGPSGEFVDTILEKKMAPDAAKEFAETINTVLKKTEGLPEDIRKDIVGSLIDGTRTFEETTDTINAAQMPLQSDLPKHIRELVLKEIAGPSSAYTMGDGSRKPQYTVEKSQELVAKLEEVFQVAKELPQAAQSKLVERIIEKKYNLETAKKLAATLLFATDETKELESKSLRADLMKHIADYNYDAEAAKQVIDAVKRTLKEGKEEYRISSELSYKKPKDWKILALTPEIEAAHKEEEERKRAAEEEASVAAVDNMVRNRAITQEHANIIHTLPKMIQENVADSLTYYNNDGNEQVLTPAETKKMVDAVRPKVEGKSAQEIQDMRFDDDVLSSERYAEKLKEETEPIIEASVSSDQPSDVEYQDVSEAEKVRLYKFPCPHCRTQIILNADELKATVEKN